MSKRSRLLVVTASAALTAAALLAGPSAARMVGSTGAASAHAVVKTHGRAYVSITHANAGISYGAGNVYDSILHTGAVTYKIKLTPQSNGTLKLNSSGVTLYAPRGSLVGTATATVTLAGTSETISDGKLKLTKGYGSLKNDSLTATFTGTGDLSANVLTYTYKGKLTEVSP
jgi:hypothetical protein